MGSSKLPPTEHLRNLTKLSSHVWMRGPTSDSCTPAPNFVVLCGWLHASIRHLSKYAEGYSSILPSSTILIVQTPMADALIPWTAEKHHRRRLKPAVDMIKKSVKKFENGPSSVSKSIPARSSSPTSLSSTATSAPSAASSITLSDTKPSMIVHAFSNAGVGTCWLLLTYLSQLSILDPLLTGLVLDSCPGSGSYRSTVNGFRVASKSDRRPLYSPVRLTFEVAAHFSVYTIHKAIPHLSGPGQNVIQLAGLGLNDPKLVGLWVPRVYLYSDSDEVIRSEEICTHAGIAKKLGYSGLQEEVFPGTGHCGHILADPERYWAAVLEVSKGGVASSAQT